MSHLQEHLGEKFQRLSADERIILALSSLEHGVDHAYLANYLSCHPADLSKMLQRLTRQKLLNSTGGRYAIYTLPMIGDNSLSIGDNGIIKDSLGRIINSSFRYYPYLVERLDDLSISYRKELLTIAQPAHEKMRLPPTQMEEIILKLCSKQYISLNALSELLNRRVDSLRQQYLSSLVKRKALLLAYPNQRTHNKQAYCTAPQQI